MAYAQTGVATMTFGNSNNVFTDLAIYYGSTGVVSHVFFGAASMYAACSVLECDEEDAYLGDALSLGNKQEPDGGQKWFWEVPSWDNAWWDGAMVMLQHGIEGPAIYGNPAFTTILGTFADKWVNGLSPIACASQHQHLCLTPLAMLQCSMSGLQLYYGRSRSWRRRCYCCKQSTQR
jgi:hypothetical protein